eukprot:CAMPEP_0185191252 /NCGR_PEP_ID=MMETSP1140-20130426/14980_1 /TAXON_ID=298111 /ORGANISM="Pavlova sp., Strain CCMP459" /LENGTH=218 /DNA_ID=CAMNT_0027757945 /DNA_START=455 /DNA_END=1110 /DNA_ORIENTATION=-
MHVWVMPDAIAEWGVWSSLGTALRKAPCVALLLASALLLDVVHIRHCDGDTEGLKPGQLRDIVICHIVLHKHGQHGHTLELDKLQLHRGHAIQEVPFGQADDLRRGESVHIVEGHRGPVGEELDRSWGSLAALDDEGVELDRLPEGEAEQELFVAVGFQGRLAVPSKHRGEGLRVGCVQHLAVPAVDDVRQGLAVPVLPGGAASAGAVVFRASIGELP